MTHTTYKFRLIALDETEFWTTLPAGVQKAYGIYLVREGEATHTASLGLFSRAVEVGVWFEPEDSAYDDDELMEAILESEHALSMEIAGLRNSYFDYIDFETTTRPHSEAFEIDIEHEYPEDPDSHIRAAEQAWVEAIEVATTSPPHFDPTAGRRVRREGVVGGAEGAGQNHSHSEGEGR